MRISFGTTCLSWKNEKRPPPEPVQKHVGMLQIGPSPSLYDYLIVVAQILFIDNYIDRLAMTAETVVS